MQPALQRWALHGEECPCHGNQRGPTSKKALPSLKLTAKAPENGWLEYQFPLGMAYFQARTVSFREGKALIRPS